MRMLLTSVVSVIAIGFPGAAIAADPPLLTETKFYVQTAAGVPAFCGVEFTLLYKDYENRRGAPAIVTGSIVWFEKDSYLQAGFKLAGADAPSFEKGDSTATHFSINQGFVAIQDKPIAPSKSTRGEDEKDVLGSYSSASASQIYGGLADNNLSVVFNREVGGLDTHLPLVVDYAAASESHELQDFRDCMATMVNRAADNSRK